MIYINMFFLIFFLITLSLSYEIILFNEELVIAIGFVSFFSLMYPIIPSLMNDFYKEDRIRVFNFLTEEFVQQSVFYRFFIETFSLWESFREFVLQNVVYSFLLVSNKFISFYSLYNNLLEENYLEKYLPESFYSFFERMISLLYYRLEQSFMGFFAYRWDVDMLEGVIESFTQEEMLSFIFTQEDITDWIYGS